LSLSSWMHCFKGIGLTDLIGSHGDSGLDPLLGLLELRDRERFAETGLTVQLGTLAGTLFLSLANHVIGCLLKGCELSIVVAGMDLFVVIGADSS
jgi:hypothetical protein